MYSAIHDYLFINEELKMGETKLNTNKTKYDKKSQVIYHTELSMARSVNKLGL